MAYFITQIDDTETGGTKPSTVWYNDKFCTGVFIVQGALAHKNCKEFNIANTHNCMVTKICDVGIMTYQRSGDILQVIFTADATEASLNSVLGVMPDATMDNVLSAAYKLAKTSNIDAVLDIKEQTIANNNAPLN